MEVKGLSIVAAPLCRAGPSPRGALPVRAQPFLTSHQTQKSAKQCAAGLAPTGHRTTLKPRKGEACPKYAPGQALHSQSVSLELVLASRPQAVNPGPTGWVEGFPPH